MILIDWVAGLVSRFLGHIIAIIWPINNKYTIVIQLVLNHSDETNTLHPEKLASKKFGYMACDR